VTFLSGTQVTFLSVTYKILSHKSLYGKPHNRTGLATTRLAVLRVNLGFGLLPVFWAVPFRAAIGFPKLIGSFSDAVLTLRCILYWVIRHVATPEICSQRSGPFIVAPSANSSKRSAASSSTKRRAWLRRTLRLRSKCSYNGMLATCSRERTNGRLRPYIKNFYIL
jgi:hypothetical protein